MQKIILLLCLLIGSQNAIAETYVSGNITQNTVWSLANSPYVIDGKVTVGNNITLTIQPGVIIKSLVYVINSSLVINGTLLAQGTSTQPIVFTSPKDDFYGGDLTGDGPTTPNSGDWSSVVIESTSGNTSIIEYCLFRFGSYYDGALTIKGSSPKVKSCIFFNCKRGIDVVNAGNPVITNNTFDACVQTPVAKDIETQVSFENNTYTNNGMKAIGLFTNTTDAPGANYNLNKSNLGNTINVPYAPLGTITIPQSNTLTIQPGVVIKSLVYQIYSTWVIKGSLSAQGTTSEPIIFTSPKDDTYGGDTNNDGLTTSNAGDWSNIVLEVTSGSSSVIQNCIFRYGTYYDGVLTIEGSSPIVNNCNFFNCKRGIYVTQNGNPSITGNTFQNCIETPVTKDLVTQVSFENNVYLNNGLNAIGLINNVTNTPDASYLINKANLGSITNAPYSPLVKLTIPLGNSLTIQPGIIIKSSVYQINSTFLIQGTLLAHGTDIEPIVFTSPKDDAYGGDTNSDGTSAPNPSDWSNIVIEATSGSSSVIENCVFRYGAYYDGALTIKGSSPSVYNCHFYKCKTGYYNNNSSVTAKMCKFIENGTGLLVDNTLNTTNFIDSSLFCHNTKGIRVLAGAVSITNSFIFKNTTYDVENLSTADILIENNWWAFDTYQSIINNPSTNLPGIFDQNDNPVKGKVKVGNPKKSQTEFDYDVSGYTAYFNNVTPLVKGFVWNFGDNNSSAQVNPAHVYSMPGYYNVCLEPTNCDVYGRGSVCKTVLVKGLTGIFPNTTGNTNTYIGIINGAGFAPGDIVSFVKQGEVSITADTVIIINQKTIKAFFTLAEAPLGNWDLYVNGVFLNDTLHNALKIEENTAISFTAFIEGRNRIRINRPTTFRIGIKNNSNQTAFGVPFYFSISHKFNIKFNNVKIPDSTSLEALTLLQNNLIKTFNEKTGDSIFVGVILVPQILSNATSYFEIELTGLQLFNDTIRAIVGSPWFTGEELLDEGILYRNGNEGCVEDCYIDLALIAAGQVPGIIGWGAKAASLVKGFNDLTSSPTDGVPFAVNLTGTYLDIALEAIGNPQSAYEFTGKIFKTVYLGFDIGFTLGKCNAKGCLDFPMPDFPASVRTSIDPNEKIGLIGSTEKNYFNGNSRIPYSIYFENIDSATASAGEVYIKDNIDTTVLNMRTLQFTGFGFGNTNVNFLTPIQDSSFTFDVNLNPDKNIIVRVRGTVDFQKGVINWSFKSFDPLTMDLTDDIDLGFLPPNVNSPEGEGFVSFSIMPKSNLPHLSEINNEAFITFDTNLPISTPIWKNTIDIVKPQSNILSFSGTQTDSVFTIKWDGTDTESGISYYDLYYSTNSSSFSWLAKVPFNQTEASFIGKDGETYCFYSIATDNAGNTENAPANPDACTSVIVGTTEQPNLGYELYQNTPNPLQDETLIGFKLPEPTKVKLIIHNTLGQQEIVLDEQLNSGFHQIKWSPEKGKGNVYFYTIITSKFTKTRKMIVNK